MTLGAIALRNVARNRRRSLLSGGVVMFGFVALTLAGGFMSQSFEALREGTIRGGTGHLQLADPGWFREGGGVETLEHGLADAHRVASRLSVEPAVAQVLRRIDFYGLLTDGERTVPFAGHGLDPAAEARTMDLPGLVIAGRWMVDRDAHEAVLGSGLAAALAVGPGDVVTLLAVTTDGVLNAVDVEIAGVARLPVRELDDRYLATSLGAADRLLEARGEVSKLVVTLHDASRVEQTGERLRLALAREGFVVEVRSWEELAVFYRQVRQLYLGMFGFLGLVLAAIVLLATANSMLMTVAERTREIGTLRALGTRSRRVARLFLAEGLLLGVLGCLAGASFSLALSWVLNRSGIMLPPPPGVAHPIPLHIDLVLTAYVGGAATMLVTVLVASWLPARRAARRSIVEALAHV